MSRIDTMIVQRDARADLDRHIGQRLKQVRQAHGMPIWKLAAAVELAVDSILDFEAGRHRTPPAVLGKVARLMGTDVRDFFEGYNP
jgi:ribosome-binding protein aMBF1 (putative translation factor)